MSNTAKPTILWQQMDQAITSWVKAALASPELTAMLGLQAVVVIVSLWAFSHPTGASWFTLSSSSLIKRFQPWRWVTYSFFHANLPHLTLNMISLYHGGYYLLFERGLGYTALIYTLGVAVPAFLWCIFVSKSSEIREIVGASTGVFALFGACAFVRPDLKLIVGFIAPIDINTGMALIMVGSLYLHAYGHWKRVWHLGHFLGGAVGFYAAKFLG